MGWVVKSKFKLAVIILLFNSCAFAVNSDQITISEKYSYYTINPSSLNEIYSELALKSPVRNSNKVYQAYTSWNVKWTYDWEVLKGKCVIKNVHSFLSIDYMLPSLEVSHQDEILMKEFNKLYQKIVEHEYGHAKNGMEAAQEVVENLSNITPVKGCYSLNKLIEKTGKQIIHKYNNKDKEYDMDAFN